MIGNPTLDELPGQIPLFHAPRIEPIDRELWGDCWDCGLDVGAAGEVYAVHNDVWPLQPDGGDLCVGCIEGRIGRELVPSDFPADESWAEGERLSDVLAELGFEGQS